MSKKSKKQTKIEYHIPGENHEHSDVTANIYIESPILRNYVVNSYYNESGVYQKFTQLHENESTELLEVFKTKKLADSVVNIINQAISDFCKDNNIFLGKKEA